MVTDIHTYIRTCSFTYIDRGKTDVCDNIFCVKGRILSQTYGHTDGLIKLFKDTAPLLQIRVKPIALKLIEHYFMVN